jgi:WhiB family redox-sensing transcriptional regulator
VKEPCLAWALESGQDAGVWGGLSEDERRALKRRAARNRARLMEQQNQI